MMTTPTLTRRIQIQTQTTTQDNFGQPQQMWTTAYTCWAAIDVQNSQLIYSTAEFLEKTVHRITIRWTSSVVIQPQMRVVYTEPKTNVTHVYLIEAILNPKQNNFWLTFLCYELDGAE